MIVRYGHNPYNVDRVSRRHRRRFKSARHFIPQTAPRLIPPGKEELYIYTVDGGIKAPL